jgi:hypothetical protein
VILRAAGVAVNDVGFAYKAQTIAESVGGATRHNVGPDRAERRASRGRAAGRSGRSCPMFQRARVHAARGEHDVRRETRRRGLQIARENQAQGWVKRFEDALAGETEPVGRQHE